MRGFQVFVGAVEATLKREDVTLEELGGLYHAAEELSRCCRARGCNRVADLIDDEIIVLIQQRRSAREREGYLTSQNSSQLLLQF
jgi:hypothetical protein